MSGRKIWEVDFNVIGPITILKDINFKQEKGFDGHQFYSDIELKKTQFGVSATITAYADNSKIAETVAFIYFGRMIDVLVFENNLPIRVFTNDVKLNIHTPKVSRRRLTKADFVESFNIARRLELEEPKLLRAMGWYSKGIITENALDQFLSYWNVIEILGKEYHTNTDRTQSGVKNQIFQSFVDHFGQEEDWNLPIGWINNMYEKRNLIVHGGEDNTVESINQYSELIPLLESTSHRLILLIFKLKYNRNTFNHFEF